MITTAIARGFTLAKELVNYILNRTLVTYIFRRESNKIAPIEDYVTFAFSIHDKITVLPPRRHLSFSIAPAQLKEEIVEFLKIDCSVNIKKVNDDRNC